MSDAGDLGELERRVAADLSLIDYPAHGWMPRLEHRGQPVLDVVIVGGGQGGLATAFALKREKIDNILVVDRSAAGKEGPWITYARMITLRTPKHVTGPDMGVPSLTPRAWFEARFGAKAWAELGKIPRNLWQDYLVWFRRVTGLPVRNQVDVTGVAPEGDFLAVTLVDRSGADPKTETVFTRKLVLATGIDGAGRWNVPGFIADSLPRDRYAHTADAIDFAKLKGKRIGLLGAGASAFDNAATALEEGVASVDLFLRRKDFPRINPYRWMEQAGFLGQFAELGDGDRWRFMRHIFDLNQPPPQDTFWRCAQHPTFAFHTGAGWDAVRMDGDEVVVDSAAGTFRFDFLIIGTGFVIDFSGRPELAAAAPHIALWSDRFAPPKGEEHAVLGTYPYLGDAFEFTEKAAGSAPWLRHVHCFTFGAMPSMGLSGASISGMKYGVGRLVQGIARHFFLADAERHYESLISYVEPELVSTEWPNPDSPPTSSTSAAATPQPASASSSSPSKAIAGAR